MIGLLGGSGAVGRQLAARLKDRGISEILVGGRDLAAAADVGIGRAVQVDIWDPVSLRNFCDESTVVVNCAGPSRGIMDRVAMAAIQTGAQYVDVGGDDPVYAKMTRPGSAPVPVSVVLSAGMFPGLTGLLPRYLAGCGFAEVDRLTVYHGVRDHIGRAGAYDFVAGIVEGGDESFAAWRSGAPLSGASQRAINLILPGFTDPVTTHPYLSPEGRRIAQRLDVRDGDWYSVLLDGQVPAVLGSLPGLTEAELVPAAERLQRAAEIDMLGRTPEVSILCQLDGRGDDGETMTRSLILRATGAAELVAAAGAVTLDEVLLGSVPPGVRFAAESLDPARASTTLAEDPGIVQLSVHDVPLGQLVLQDEGAI